MYAMVAAGLALMLGVARLINFAHGEFFMLGPYAFWLGYSELGLPYPVPPLLAPAGTSIFIAPYFHTVLGGVPPASWPRQRTATLARSLVVSNLASICFRTHPYEVPTRPSPR